MGSVANYTGNLLFFVVPEGIWKPIIKLGWDAFLTVCVLSGTDYNVGVLGVGIKTAIKLVTEHKTLESVVEALQDPSRPQHKQVPKDFLSQAKRAVLMFKHALAFDPYRTCVCHASDLPPDSAPLLEVGSPNWMGRIPECSLSRSWN